MISCFAQIINGYVLGYKIPSYSLCMRTLAMLLPVFNGGGIIGVRIAIVAEMRAGIVFADILRHNTTTRLALTFIFMLRVCIISDNPTI